MNTFITHSLLSFSVLFQEARTGCYVGSDSHGELFLPMRLLKLWSRASHYRVRVMTELMFRVVSMVQSLHFPTRSVHPTVICGSWLQAPATNLPCLCVHDKQRGVDQTRLQSAPIQWATHMICCLTAAILNPVPVPVVASAQPHGTTVTNDPQAKAEVPVIKSKRGNNAGAQTAGARGLSRELLFLCTLSYASPRT
ncbi:hypothetical protein BDW75DRAFT_206401 [Aspergillus navahoensis]